jgi:hypothetical protein
MFTYGKGGTDETTGMTTAEVDQSELSFVVGLGPVYTPSERTSVAMYGTFEYVRSETDDGATSTNFTSNDYVIPGWHVAGEFEVASWLQARVGLESRLQIDTDKTEAPAPATPEEDQDVRLLFRWHSGLGFSLGNFQIDTYLDPSVITSGTDLLGESTDTFGLVTASYSF